MSPRQAAAYLFFREKREIRDMIRAVIIENHGQAPADDLQRTIDKWMDEL